ncbi:MAG: Zn-dependent protease, partial [Phycisphaerae bacterium]|nr:Zn-dependent protease [Phycisphaerae bacterium]
DVEAALRAYSAARALAPGNAEMIFWTAVSLANAGKVEEAVPLFHECFKDTQGDWRTTLQRLPKSGLFPDDPAVIGRILDDH